MSCRFAKPRGSVIQPGSPWLLCPQTSQLCQCSIELPHRHAGGILTLATIQHLTNHANPLLGNDLDGRARGSETRVTSHLEKTNCNHKLDCCDAFQTVCRAVLPIFYSTVRLRGFVQFFDHRVLLIILDDATGLRRTLYLI